MSPYALMQSGDAEEIVLTDASERFARGRARRKALRHPRQVVPQEAHRLEALRVLGDFTRHRPQAMQPPVL